MFQPYMITIRLAISKYIVTFRIEISMFYICIT
jgi:hypothetical protein